MAYSRASDLKFVKIHKDDLDKLSHSNVFYRISCRDCEAFYVGRTKKQLKTRLQEHKNDIKESSSLFIISRHRLSSYHEFDWNGIEILNEE
jgi:hypothetical protein